MGIAKLVVLGFFGVMLLVGGAFADIRLPAIIGDNMVLQQGEPVAIWGWAGVNEQVTGSVSWHSMQWSVIADKDGKWRFDVTAPEVGTRLHSRVQTLLLLRTSLSAKSGYARASRTCR